MRRTRVPTASFLSVLLPLALCAACRRSGEPVPGGSGEGAGAVAAAASGQAPVFEDATEDVGLDYVHVNGMTGKMHIVEMMGPGGALFDYDGDGDLDVLLRQGGALEPDSRTEPGRPVDRLYRNDPILAEGGSAGFRLVDVSERSRIGAPGYGMGVAVGDVDNDGWPDLYLTDFGPNRMLRNDGDGTFADVTAATGTGDGRWSVAASFADFDRDGWLDLYVGNYVDFDLAGAKTCTRATGAPEYCGPLSYRPEPDRLFVNRQGGRWEDATIRSGLAGAYGNTLGSLVVDPNEDGWPDLYVANDATENQLWINLGDGSLRDEAALRGCAVNVDGAREGSMGVDGGDLDGDGDEDLVITHLATETDTVYVNQGAGVFLDRTTASGLAARSRPFTGFGTSLLDYDNDGWPDLLVLNGHVHVIEQLEAAGDPLPLHQRNQLYRNRGDGTFDEVTEGAGAVFALSEVSRGAALGDVDNDGDTDVVVVNNNGPARLLRNRVGQAAHWLGLRLLTTSGGRDALGARVAVRRSGEGTLVRRLRTDGSYASARDPRILAGLGEHAAVSGVRIEWVSGRVQEVGSPPVDRYLVLFESESDVSAAARPDA